MNISKKSFGRIGGVVGHLLGRFHIAFYTLTVVIAVSVAMFLLNNILSLSNQSTPPAETPSVFTDEFVDRIREFNASSENIENTLTLPDGRISPFHRF